MDVRDKLAEIRQVVADARAMPMSASCLINREEVLAQLDELGAAMPRQLLEADEVISSREAVVGEGREAAEQLMREAQAERDRLVEREEVLVAARQRAATVRAEAEAEAARLLADTDDYVDRKLAEFEVALHKLTQQVVRGRASLSARQHGGPVADATFESPPSLATDALDAIDAPEAAGTVAVVDDVAVVDVSTDSTPRSTLG